MVMGKSTDAYIIVIQKHNTEQDMSGMKEFVL